MTLSRKTELRRDTPAAREFANRRSELKRSTQLSGGELAAVTRKPSSLGRGKPAKPRQAKRDWSDARAKVDNENVCRVGSDGQCAGKLEAAHIIGREHDRPRYPEQIGNTLYVDPARIVPLCTYHHRRYDPHTRGTQEPVDILQALSTEEQAQAVADCGSIELAWQRTAPATYARLYDVDRIYRERTTT